MKKLTAYLLAMCALGAADPVRAQEAVDPALAKSWEFMQQAMPGVPYALLKNACAEGNLTFYHSTTKEAADNQADQFKSRFPCINVLSLELATGPLRERFVSESRAKRGVADITQDNDPGALEKEIAAGMFTEYKIANDAAYPNAMKHSGYWYPLQLVMVGIAWNTNLVTDEEAKILADWKGITDKRWAGKAGITDPSAGGVSVLAWYAWIKLYGDDFISKVGALKPHDYPGTNPASAALASGDIAILLNASESGLMPLYLAGAPIRWTLPEPAIGTPLAQAISSLAPHPNAAKLYQEYAFTLEGYSAWQKLGGGPTRTGFKDLRQIANESWYKDPTKFFASDPADVNNTTSQIVDRVHKDVGTIR